MELSVSERNRPIGAYFEERMGIFDHSCTLLTGHEPKKLVRLIHVERAAKRQPLAELRQHPHLCVGVETYSGDVALTEPAQQLNQKADLVLSHRASWGRAD